MLMHPFERGEKEIKGSICSLCRHPPKHFTFSLSSQPRDGLVRSELEGNFSWLPPLFSPSVHSVLGRKSLSYLTPLLDLLLNPSVTELLPCLSSKFCLFLLFLVENSEFCL
ncbi:hypothetical protein BRADI_5g11846v3 [Brachypodium distachyon]|uniref:Uncharacterized protein n=1 Tax=Brachypodium distachyon TaxID=15368 RepID=A0A0Q3E4X2_BRADI|nr:hypothetical protein BRADI_5g11846v3 [Brachypodium distachyon]